MHLVTTPVTGAENPATVPQEEVRALVRFYRAFNERSLPLMRACWLTTSECSMDNPIGGIRRGWDEVAGGYERLFGGPAVVAVELYDYSLHTSGDAFFAVGRERGHVRLGDTALDLAIRTTRVFVRRDGEWKQAHHHGSIDDPGLLEAYQAAVAPR